jgi:hypothetical protein
MHFRESHLHRLNPDEVINFLKRETAGINPALEQAIRTDEKFLRTFARLPLLKDYLLEDTGWSVDLRKVHFSAGTPSEVVAAAAKDSASYQASTRASGAFRKLVEEGLEFLKGRLIAAVYLKNSSQVMFNTLAADAMNAPALEKTAYHELVHLAQHQNYPQLFDSLTIELEKLRKVNFSAIEESLGRSISGLDDILPELKNFNFKNVWKGLSTSVGNLGTHFTDAKKPIDEFRDVLDTITARMCLVEGQATYLENLKASERFPNHEMTFEPIDIAFSLVASALFFFKIKQYIVGMSGYKRVMEEPNGIALVNLMCENPTLADAMFKQRGPVIVVPSAGFSADQLKPIVKQLKNLNRKEVKTQIKIVK